MRTENCTELPKRQTKMSAGYDFYAPYDITLKPGWFRPKWYTIDLMAALTDADAWNTAGSEDWFMLLVPRSGMGAKYGYRFRNTVGIIDQDYRDTIKVTVAVEKPLIIKKGDRIAQGIIIPYGKLANEITPVKDRQGGHGSTGQ